MDRFKKVVDRHFPLHKSQILRQAFADAEHHRCDGDRLRVLDPVAGIPHRQPQAAGRPDGVIRDFLFSQQTHNIQGALVGHLDANILPLCKIFQNRLQLRVFRAGNNTQHRAAAAQNGVGFSFVCVSLIAAAAYGYHERKHKQQSGETLYDIHR